MNLLEQIDYDRPKLIAIYVGGKIDGISIEAHNINFVVAKHYTEVIEKVRKLWPGDQKSLHIDSWLPLEVLEGYEITPVKNIAGQSNKESLYFINLGCYSPGQFGEAHHFFFVIAKDKTEAKAKAKLKLTNDFYQLHTDNLIDIDDCIRLDHVDEYYLDIQYGSQKLEINFPTNGWQRLPVEKVNYEEYYL